MNAPTDHQHHWVETINSMLLTCQVCRWRKDHMTGDLYPPSENQEESKITEA